MPERAGTPRRTGVRIGGGGDFLALPNTTFALEAAALLLVGENRFEIRGILLAPSSARSNVDTAATASMLLVAGGLRYFRTFVPRAIELGACASFEAGALHGTSAGVMCPPSGTSPWVAPGVGLLSAWPFISRLARGEPGGRRAPRTRELPGRGRGPALQAPLGEVPVIFLSMTDSRRAGHQPQ